MPPPAVPHRVHVVPELVVDANGKRDLDATRRLARSTMAGAGLMDADVLVVGAGIAGLAVAGRLLAEGLSVEVVERSPELRATGAGIMLHPNALACVPDLLGELRRHGTVIERQVVVDAGDTTVVDWRQVWGDARGEAALPVAVHRAPPGRAPGPGRAARAGAVGHGSERARPGRRGRVGAVARRPAPLPAGRGRGRGGLVGPGRGRPGGRPPPARADLLEDDGRRAPAVRRPGVARVASGRPLLRGDADRGRAGHVFVQDTSAAPDASSPQDARATMRTLARGMGAAVEGLVPRLGEGEGEEVDVRRPLGVAASRMAAGRVVLVGDAAHAVSPATTQGGALAVEDAAVLADEVGRHGPCPAAALAFERRRRPRVECFVRLARMHLALMESMRPVAVPRAPGRGQVQDGAAWFRRLYAPLMTAP